MARIEYMTHYHDSVRPWLIFYGGDNRNGTVTRCFPVLLTIHWKYIVVIGYRVANVKNQPPNFEQLIPCA